MLAACAEKEAAEPVEPSEDEPEWDYIAEVNMTYLDLNMKGETSGDMLAALNKITEEKIGVHVNLMPFNVGDYSTQVTLAIAGGETVDIVGLTPIPGSDFLTMMANNQLLDISSYLEQDYASHIHDAVGNYLGAFTVNGGIYGMPAKRDWAASSYINMRADILDELGLREKAENMTIWAEYEEILRAVKEAHPDMYPVTNGDSNIVVSSSMFNCNSYADRGAFRDGENYDTVGDALELVYCDLDGNVKSFADQAFFADMCAMVAAWADEGLLYPDAAFTQETGRTLMQNNVGFSFMCTGEGQVASDVAAATGYEIVSVPISDQILTTSVAQTWGSALTVNCEEPEAAIRLLDLMYSDAEVMNLLTYGIEGTDYTLSVDNEAVYDVSNCNWHGSDWLMGNMFLTLPQAGTGADFRNQRLSIVEAVQVSPFNGFSLDTSELSNVLASLTGSLNEYLKPIRCGGYSEDMLTEFQNSLKGAGMDEYISAIQSQLDAWRGQ